MLQLIDEELKTVYEALEYLEAETSLTDDEIRLYNKLKEYLQK